VNESGAERMYWLVAIAYLLRKTPYVFPILGGRKVEHLKQNIRALDVLLSPEQIHHIDDAKPFDLGFPHTVVVCTPIYSNSLLQAQLKI
jgi:diketogulonate reductase-like aldo/keto reductase